MNLFSVCGQILVSVKPIGIDKFILDMYEVRLTVVVTSFEQKHRLMPRIMSFFKTVAASQLLSAELV